jgi:hypothetical protein
MLIMNSNARQVYKTGDHTFLNSYFSFCMEFLASLVFVRQLNLINDEVNGKSTFIT